MKQGQVSRQTRLHSSWIDHHAKEIVRKLQSQGFTTYLVGGCVRDLLVGFVPKDFDIGTLAVPDVIRKNFRHAYIIGRRFRLVLVKRLDRNGAEKQFEVATFRRNPKPQEKTNDSLLNKDNLFGSPREDAYRRDFTINALLYDPIKEELIDYCDGLEDLEQGIVRMIGDPDTRLQEDPIRIFRALRFAQKLGFTIETSLLKAIPHNTTHLKNSVLPRRREEILKLLRLQDPARALHLAHEFGILKNIAPTLDQVYQSKKHCEIFEKYLNRIQDFVTDFSSPTQLFTFLIFAFYRTIISDDPTERISTTEILEHPILQSLMKFELGTFNHEQRFVSKVISLQSSLIDLDYYKKRIQRRKLSTIKNEAFEMALHIGQIDYSVIGSTLNFWVEAQQELSHLIKKKQTYN